MLLLLQLLLAPALRRLQLVHPRGQGREVRHALHKSTHPTVVWHGRGAS